MGDILNPAEINFFADLVKAKDFKVFVDKTEFIAKTNALLNPIFALLLTHNAPRTCFRFKDPLGLPGFLFATALSISTF